MSKQDHSLMMLTCLIPSSEVREAMIYLEDHRAREIGARPYRVNGEVSVEAPAKGKSAISATSTVGISREQQAWIAKHAKGEFYSSDLKEAWEKAGFRPGGLYQALARAVALKVIKKLSSGSYKTL